MRRVARFTKEPVVAARCGGDYDPAACVCGK